LKSAHIQGKRETTRKNRLNHRADVGDVFCYSLTRGEEISLAHIHKKRSPSLSLPHSLAIADDDAAKLQRRRRSLSYRNIDHQGRKNRVELTPMTE
jgi:hypothetical protein